jgi:protein-S-isoprenylcysteine O-methyltransferase
MECKWWFISFLLECNFSISTHDTFKPNRYSILRHPSYVGFFYWAIGTQLILCNPLSTILYGLAAWTFFSRRIVYEESTLRALFPGDYERYSSRTYVGIPLIHMLSLSSDDAKEE